jgi:hypothetical protein
MDIGAAPWNCDIYYALHIDTFATSLAGTTAGSPHLKRPIYSPESFGAAFKDIGCKILFINIADIIKADHGSTPYWHADYGQKKL